MLLDFLRASFFHEFHHSRITNCTSIAHEICLDEELVHLILNNHKQDSFKEILDVGTRNGLKRL